MLSAIYMFISSFGNLVGSILNIDISLSDQVDIQVYDLVVFFFVLYIFIKFFEVVTNNSTDSRR